MQFSHDALVYLQTTSQSFRGQCGVLAPVDCGVYYCNGLDLYRIYLLYSLQTLFCRCSGLVPTFISLFDVLCQSACNAFFIFVGRIM